VKRGEKAVFIGIMIFVIFMMARNLWTVETSKEIDKGIPYYTTASADLTRDAMDVYRKQNCKNCHSLWTVRNMLDNVPAPILDGLGSLHSEEWFYQYFSAENPQSIVPSRLKQEFRMPSYSQLSESDRHLLASYMAKLKVKDWYLEETRKAEFEKLTGKEYKP
jgi:cbb3-type cytochrome oxidase cytochrome c subunit